MGYSLDKVLFHTGFTQENTGVLVLDSISMPKVSKSTLIP